MLQITPEQFGVLAEGGWQELIPLLIFVGISVASGIAKAMSKGSDSEKKQDDSTKKLIEMAKRYKAMKETGRQPDVPTEQAPYARTEMQSERKPGSLTEWDRRQREKKQQTQQRRQEPDRPRYVPEKPKPPAVKPPEEIPVAYAVPQAQPVRKPRVRPQIPKKRPPKRAAQPTVKRQPAVIPTAHPVAKYENAKKHVKKKTESVMPAGTSFKALLKKRKSLRTAILLKEIIDKPIALRDF